LRWFSGLQASNFNNIQLVGGERYGEFTRQSGLLYNDETPTYVWQMPAASGNYLFDPLKTSDMTFGEDPVAAGQAVHTVIVPEPASLSLALLGAIGLFGLRRRR
jgi:hypothetical protein